MVTEAQLKAKNKYNKKAYKNYSFRLNKNTEKNVIDWIEKQGKTKPYLYDLIIDDIKKKGAL